MSFFLEFQDQFFSDKTRYPYAIHSEHFLQNAQLHELFNTLLHLFLFARAASFL